MARGRERDGRRRWRERLAVGVMALFPLLVASGFMTPGWVRVLALAQELENDAPVPVVDRAGRFGHRPLVVPRDFSTGVVPELLDLDQIFIGDAGQVRVQPQQIASVSSFERSDADSIVVSSVGTPNEVEFKDALMSEPSPEFASMRQDGLLPLCGTLHAGNCIRDDDFGGGPTLDDTTPIPEPSTAALLGLGLAGLALFRRRS